KDVRPAAPVPLVGCAVAEPTIYKLQPVVVVHVVVERRIRAEPLFDHLPSGVVADRVGVVDRCASTQGTAETGEPARLIMAVIDGVTRRIGQSLDIASQVVALLSDVRCPPIAPAPEILPLRERPSERVVTVYRRLCGVNAALLRVLIMQTPFPVH